MHVEAIDDAGNSSGIESSSMLATPTSDTVSSTVSAVSGISSNSNNAAFAKARGRDHADSRSLSGPVASDGSLLNYSSLLAVRSM